MAYQMAATAVTLNDLEGHSLVAGLFKCNPSNIYTAFYTTSTDIVLARSLCISRASCVTLKILHGMLSLIWKTQSEILLCIRYPLASTQQCVCFVVSESLSYRECLALQYKAAVIQTLRLDI